MPQAIGNGNEWQDDGRGGDAQVKGRMRKTCLGLKFGKEGSEKYLWMGREYVNGVSDSDAELGVWRVGSGRSWEDRLNVWWIIRRAFYSSSRCGMYCDCFEDNCRRVRAK